MIIDFKHAGLPNWQDWAHILHLPDLSISKLLEIGWKSWKRFIRLLGQPIWQEAVRFWKQLDRSLRILRCLVKLICHQMTWRLWIIESHPCHPRPNIQRERSDKTSDCDNSALEVKKKWPLQPDLWGFDGSLSLQCIPLGIYLHYLHLFVYICFYLFLFFLCFFMI